MAKLFIVDPAFVTFSGGAMALPVQIIFHRICFIQKNDCCAKNIFQSMDDAIYSDRNIVIA